MSYVVHNFQDGQTIFASPINQMDAQILKNEQDIEKRIKEPIVEGTNGQALVTDGHGERKWSDVASAEYIGDKNNLTTHDKSTIVAGINEVDGDVGDLTNLKTTNKTNLVAAANELYDDVEKIGNLNTLKTDEKNHIVAAINEVVDNIGDLDTLDTEDKTTVVKAINEIVDKIGDLDDLETEDKDTIIDAVNELDALIKRVEKMFAYEYDKNGAYEPGDIVVYNDKLHVALMRMNPAGEFDDTKWEGTNVDLLLDEVKDDIYDTRNMIAEDFSKDKAYHSGDIVVHEDKVYTAKEDIAAGDWDDILWDETNVADELDKDKDEIEKMISDDFDASKTYNIGDIVIYNNKLYECKEAIDTPEDFDADKWNVTKLTNLLGGGDSTLTDRTTGAKYKIFVDNGIIGLEEVN